MIMINLKIYYEIYLPTRSSPFSTSCNLKAKLLVGLSIALDSSSVFLIGVIRRRGGVFHFFLNSNARDFVIGPANARTSKRGLIGSVFKLYKNIIHIKYYRHTI